MSEKAIIRFNKDAAGIELVIPSGRKLEQAELQVLRSLGFCWHRKNKYYYTRYTEEKMELIRASFLGKEAQFPAKTAEKVVKEMAAAKAKAEAEAPKKARAPRAGSQAARLEVLEGNMAKLTEMFGQFLASQGATSK